MLMGCETCNLSIFSFYTSIFDPSYVPGYRYFDDCFLFCCALESSCLGRLSAIKVQLEISNKNKNPHL